MDARGERDTCTQRESESDRKRQNPDMPIDYRICKKKIKLYGKTFKVSTNTKVFYRILRFTWLSCSLAY